MGIIERAEAFVEGLRELATRDRWGWRRCPRCGSSETICNGHYERHPYTFGGREQVAIQRHVCRGCGRSYSERVVWLAERRRYSREVQRLSLDLWLHFGSSLRRSAELVRSLLGHQERFLIWQPTATARPADECHLSPSTIGRWLDRAGKEAEETLVGQLLGGKVQAVAADGLWARLRGGGKRVVLMIVDSASGLVFPPLVAKGEQSEGPWARLFARAESAGLDLDELRGVTSDWTGGLVSYLRRFLPHPHHQRCLWHFHRAPLRRLLGALDEDVREAVSGLVRSLMSATSYAAAELALVALAVHPAASELAREINEQFDHLFVHLLPHYRGLTPVSPEWCWRDYRLRLSRGRNHGSEKRLECASLLWAIYHNFTPTQRRCERKRHYRHPGKSPLEVVGLSPGNLSYLDALAV